MPRKTKSEPERKDAPAPPRGKVAFLVDNLFEDAEFRVPFDRLRDAGYAVLIVGKEAGAQLTGKKGREKIVTERAIGDVSADELDGVVIPGGYSPDHLRTDEAMVELVRDLFDAGKPVAAVCHAGWMLAEADIAVGRTLTSWPSIKTDLINAGARWINADVVEDGNLITSRKPDDLPAFSEAILRQLAGHIPPRLEAPELEREDAEQPIQ